MMDNLSIRAAEDFVHAGYPVDAAAILLCELDGTNAEVSEQIMACAQGAAGSRRDRSAHSHATKRSA
jgi:glycolate oxidase